MRFAMRATRFLVAATLVLAPGFTSAFAREAAPRFNVQALTLEEMMNEYGAGGGGGGTNPVVVDPGDSGYICFQVNVNGCSLADQPDGSDISWDWAGNEIGIDTAQNPYGTSPVYQRTFEVQCRREVVAVGGSVSVSGGGFNIGTQYFCESRKTITINVPNGYFVPVLKRAQNINTTEYYKIVWMRNGLINGYYGSKWRRITEATSAVYGGGAIKY